MGALTATWQAPPVWSVPREWVGERCFVICGGASVNPYRQTIPRLAGRVIAVKHAALLRTDADVLFWAGERADVLAPPVLPRYLGPRIVVRGKGHHVFPPTSLRVGRTATHERWSTDPTQVAGFDAGTSAINLAILFGATEIVLLGYDMMGSRWFDGPHPHPQPAEAEFLRHMQPLPALAEDARRLGVRIVNCSNPTRVQAFERQPLEAFL